MADEQSAPVPPHRPESTEFRPLGFWLGVDFFPPIKLDKKSGLEFASSLTGHMDPGSVELQSHQWQYTSGELEITVTANNLQLVVSDPARASEWVDERYRILLTLFENSFSPKMLLGSRAMVRGLMKIHGDVRVFLGARVMRMPVDKLKSLGRPLHAIGLRLFFPPFQVKATEEETDWSVDVKLESWLEDPSMLFIEADALWQDPVPWNEESSNQVNERLQTVQAFLKDNLARLLQQQNGEEPSGENDNDD